jgi:alkylation response protein AidB-like acyl-CoA dehydrogenase
MSAPSAQTTPDSTELRTQLVARARALAPLFEIEGPKAEALRRPTDEAIDAVKAANLYPLLVPRRLGGHQLDLDSYVDVGLELARGDASLAWTTLLYIHHNWIFCQFPEAFQEEVFADGPHIPAPACPSFTASARRVEGGYRLSGRWSFATCIMHATWLVPGVMCSDDEEMRFFALPIEEAEVHDIWNMSGMSGTGSNDFSLDDVFVPEERMMSIPDLYDGAAPGATLHSDCPAIQTPMMVMLMLGGTVVLTGQARASVDRLRDRMGERVLMYQTGGKQADSVAAQIRLGRLQLEAEQAEMFLRTSIAEIMAKRDAGKVTLEARAANAARMAFVAKQCREIIGEVSEASGTSSFRSDNPIQRSLRDANVLSSHMMYSTDQRMETLGRVLLGLDVNTIIL